MGKLFGTDGIRGIAGKDLTCELAMKVGEAAAYVLGENQKIKVVVGSDTRKSGDMISSAIISGLLNYGADVINLGIIPTPAVSYLVKKYNADMGVMISASHNPSEYNGIKLFNKDGYKLPDETENRIEKYILDNQLPISNELGNIIVNNNAIKDYVFYLKSNADISKDLKIIVDCANGSASITAPLLFEELGVNVNFINYNYDGLNINKNCGSTHLEGLIEKIKLEKADVGVAYDGDADRCLMVDNQGNIVNGDAILAIVGSYLKNNHSLTNNTIVGTIMSNLGLKKFCENNEINFIETKVGDRYVLEKMLEDNYIIGGEQSGHVIFKELSTTGDGELTSIMILNILSKTKKTLSELASIMVEYPQVLINVEVTPTGKNLYVNDIEINKLIEKINDTLKDTGRVLIRPSGTEPLIRVMLEGLDIDDITLKANQIADLIRNKYGKN